MQFEVPQYIDVEDKIVGPLTLRQFLTIVVTFVILALLYFILPLIIFIIAAIPFAILGGLMAFYKINGRPFYFFLIHLTGYLTRPRLRLWRRDPNLPAIKAQRSQKEVSEANQRKQLKLERVGLERLSYILDHSATDTDSVYAEVLQEKLKRTSA